MKTNDEIIKEEIGAILDDLTRAYNNSGRKVSGQFERQLEAVYSHNTGTVRGVLYMSGRGATKKGNSGGKTVLEQIKIWQEKKGILAKYISELQAKSKKPFTDKKKKRLAEGLAFLITRKIHKEGTDREKWFRIYESVITDERIDKIIDRIAKENANRVVTSIRAHLEILEKEQ